MLKALLCFLYSEHVIIKQFPTKDGEIEFVYLFVLIIWIFFFFLEWGVVYEFAQIWHEMKQIYKANPDRAQFEVSVVIEEKRCLKYTLKLVLF